MVEVGVARVGEASGLASRVRVGMAIRLITGVGVGMTPWLAAKSSNNHWNKKDNQNLTSHC